MSKLPGCDHCSLSMRQEKTHSEGTQDQRIHRSNLLKAKDAVSGWGNFTYIALASFSNCVLKRPLLSRFRGENEAHARVEKG